LNRHIEYLTCRLSTEDDSPGDSMTSIILPRLAVDLAAQRSTRRMRSLATGAQLNPTGSSVEEAGLVARAKQGNGASFEALYSLHKRRVYSFCRQMSGNEAEAEDLTQETFLRVYREIEAFDGPSSFSTWLEQVARNVVLMRAGEEGFLAGAVQEPVSPQRRKGPPRDIGIADYVLARSIERIALARAIGKLPSGYRKVLVLFHIKGYKHNEIAKLIGCTAGNSRSQLHMARLKVRRFLMAGDANHGSNQAEDAKAK